MDNEADSCMFSALALLVRIPKYLMPCTPKTIHSKFLPFLREIGKNYAQTEGKEAGTWRFLAENYKDTDLAISLQNKEFLEDPKDDMVSTISQYQYLINRANTLYASQYEGIKKARALSSVINSADPVEVAKALSTYEQSRK